MGRVRDSLHRMADPDAEQPFRRIMQAACKDYNQESWWKPGELTPERGAGYWSGIGEVNAD